MSVKTFVESIVSQITVSGDTFAFAHGEKDFQNLFSDEAVYPIVYLDEPIQNDFQIVSSGAIQEYYPIQLMILYKTELDFTPDQHDVLIQKARLCARKFLTLAGMSQQIRNLDSIKGIEVINVFDANTSGIVLSCRLSFYDSTSICADYDPVQGFVVLTNSNDSWSGQAQNNTHYIVPNTVFEILDQNGDNYGEYSVPSVNGGTVTISVAPCDLATYQNSDGSFIQTIASGDTFVSDDITVNVYDQNETLVASETVSSNINVDLTVNIPEIEVNADVLNTLGEIVATKLVTPTDNEITAPDGSVHLKKENDGSITTLSIPSGATENYVVQNNDITVNGANGFEIHATDPLDVRLRNESNQVVQPISVTHAGNHATIILPTNEIDVTINGITVANDAISDVALTLVDQNGDDVPFVQTGNELEVQVGEWVREWVRPTDWLPIPSISSGEQVFYGLCMVYQDRANLVSLSFTGNYTVDWGDGIIENFASNVVAHHQYSWASVGHVTNEGFRQALIKVTPQAGQNLTGINLQIKHPLMGGGNLKNSIFIDMVMNLPQLTSGASIVLGGTSFIRHAFVERVNIMSIGSATSFVNLCYLFYKLQKFEIGDTSSVTNMSSMFYGCSDLTTVPLFNTANVQNMSSMFFECITLTTVPLFNTANVQNMSSMFQNCYTLTTVPLFNTANVTNMVSMFLGCSSLTTVPLFNTSSVTNMPSMFQNCYSLTTVSLFNTANVTNMSSMFLGCYSLQTVTLFNTSSVTNMQNMFQFCYNLTTVTLFNTANVTNMVSMFLGCSSLQTVTLNLSSVSVLANIFLSTINIDTLILNGCRYGFSISNNEMSATALNNMFTSLGTAAGSQTITVTGNPGALTCNTTIATAKGFTVVI